MLKTVLLYLHDLQKNDTIAVNIIDADPLAHCGIDNSECSELWVNII